MRRWHGGRRAAAAAGGRGAAGGCGRCAARCACARRARGALPTRPNRGREGARTRGGWRTGRGARPRAGSRHSGKPLARARRGPAAPTAAPGGRTPASRNAAAAAAARAPAPKAGRGPSPDIPPGRRPPSRLAAHAPTGGGGQWRAAWCGAGGAARRCRCVAGVGGARSLVRFLGHKAPAARPAPPPPKATPATRGAVCVEQAEEGDRRRHFCGAGARGRRTAHRGANASTCPPPPRPGRRAPSPRLAFRPAWRAPARGLPRCRYARAAPSSRRKRDEEGV